MKEYIQDHSLQNSDLMNESFSIADYEKLKQAVPRILPRVNMIFLELNMSPQMSDIEMSCKSIVQIVSEILKSSVLLEKTITDIYNYICKNKN